MYTQKCVSPVKDMLVTIFSLLLVGISFSPCASAQSTVGQISGNVTDQTGAAVTGANVTATNEATGLARTATTNDDGFYVITNLPPGIYRVASERQNFKRALQANNNLVADGRLTLDLTLEPGDVAETVEVTAAVAETVNTTSGEVARVVDGEQVRNLALNGRNYIQLTTLIPGAPLTQFNPLQQTTGTSAAQSINGNRPNTNNVTVDGGLNLNKSNNSEQNHNVGIDFIQEVKIQTSNFSAEYGRQSGASINVVTRSGENDFHGSAFEYFRNEVLDTRSFFAPRRNRLRFNDFGYSFGGPVVKNKFFFFGGQEWKYVRQDSDALRRTLPTRAQRRGDFSGTAGTLNRPGTTTPVPGRNISSLMTADGRAIAAVYDSVERLASSYVDTPTPNNAIFQTPTPFDFRQDILRLDYRFNDRHNVFGRYLHDINTLTNPFGISQGSALPTIPSERTRPAHGLQLSHTWLIGPTLINEAKYNYASLDLAVSPVGDIYRRATYGFAYPQLFDDGTYPDGIPDINITGFAGFRGPSALQTSLFVDHSLSDNLTIIRGTHTVKTGAWLYRGTNDQNGVVTSVYTGVANFNPAGNTNSTGNALADALLGNYRTYNEIQRPIPTFFITNQYEAYVTDNWKVRPRLSFEYGFRYHHIQPLYAQANNLVNFNPSLYDPARAVTVITVRGNAVIDRARGGDIFNGLVRVGNEDPSLGELSPGVGAVPTGAPRALQRSANVFAPRVSFAYSPLADNKTAIRGGFGVFFDSVQGDLTQRAAQNPPFTNLAQFENGNLSALSLDAALPSPFGQIVAIDPNLKTPYTMNFSLGVQRELPRGFFAEAAYVGNLGRHLLRRPDINQPAFQALANRGSAAVNAIRPYRGFSEIIMSLSDANSNYNALQLYVAKRSGNLRLTGSYTFSKALTDASGAADNPEDPFNRSFNYGPASFDRRHIFVSTYTYSVPFFRRYNAFVRALFSGYEISGITRFQTGQYFNVTSDTAIGNRRADYIGGEVNLPSGEQQVNRWFNTSAFAPAPNTRRGTSGVGIIEGPGQQLWDLSLRKGFGLTEDLKMQFQADLFNVFNRANFLGVNTNVSNPDFGTVTTSAPGRNIQLGFRLTF